MSQEFKSSFAGWIWLQTSHEAAYKIKAKTVQSSEDSARAGGSLSKMLTYMAIGKRPQFLSVDLAIGCLSVLTTCQLTFFRARQPWESREESASAFYGLLSEVTHCRFYDILLEASYWVQPHSKRGELSFTFWWEECQRICGHVKTPQVEPVPRWCRHWVLDRTLSRRC